MAIHEIEPADFPEIVSYFDRQLAKTQASPGPGALLAYLRWIECNPARAGVPIGWIVRHNGAVAGQYLAIPQPFAFRGRKHTFVLINHLFADAGAPMAGVMLLSKIRELTRQFPVFGATVNARSAPFWRASGARTIPGGDLEYLRMLNWKPIAAEMLQRRLPRPLARTLAFPLGLMRAVRTRPHDDLTWRRADAADCAEAFPVNDEEINVDRSSTFLQWRVQCPFYDEGHLFRFTGADIDACVMVGIRPRGRQQRIRALCLLDYWGNIGPLGMRSLCDALANQFWDRADLIVARDLSDSAHGAFARSGFRRRLFSCPGVWVVDRDGMPGEHAWRLMPSTTDVM
jgi:hypothetical protein